MTETERQTYRAALQAQLAALEQEDALGQQAQATVQLDQQSVGRLSRMDALQNQAMARAQQSRRDNQRRRIRAALDRMNEDEFGYCLDCGDEIDTRRLTLDPATPKCFSCAAG